MQRLRRYPFLCRSALSLSLLTLALSSLTSACGPKQGEGLVAQSPERQSDAEYNVALDDFSRGNSREALDHIRKAIELNDSNDRALYLAAGIHLSFCATVRGFASPDCNLAEAERYARLALKANDSYRDARNMLGQILINEKKYGEAIAVLTPLTQDPAYANPHLAWGNLGWAQVESGQLDAGIASLKNAVTNPRFCVGEYHLGMAYEKKGDLPSAEASLTIALSVEDPACKGLQEAWEERARVRMRLGKTTDAESDFEKCRDIAAESVAGKECASALGGAKPPAPTP